VGLPGHHMESHRATPFPSHGLSCGYDPCWGWEGSRDASVLPRHQPSPGHPYGCLSQSRESRAPKDFIPPNARSSPFACIAPEPGNRNSPAPQLTADRTEGNLHLYSTLHPPAPQCFDFFFFFF